MTKTTEMTNNNELNEMELEQVNGGCDPVRMTDEFEIVQCKRCGDYYLTMNPHICLRVPELYHDNELPFDFNLYIDGRAAAQE